MDGYSQVQVLPNPRIMAQLLIFEIYNNLELHNTWGNLSLAACCCLD